MTRRGQPPEPGRRRPRRDLALHRQMISEGVAAAGRRGGAADRVTTRRVSLLLSRAHDEGFARGLIRFAASAANPAGPAAQAGKAPGRELELE